jgi:hypothetical protein
MLPQTGGFELPLSEVYTAMENKGYLMLIDNMSENNDSETVFRETMGFLPYENTFKVQGRTL